MFVGPLFALLVVVAPSLQLGPSMGPVGRIDIKKIDECPKFDSAVKVQFTKDSKNRRVINAQLKLKEDYNNAYAFKVNVHKWTGSEFKMNMMKYEGKLCDYLNKFLKAVRESVYKMSKISGTCDIKAGNYDAKGIYAIESQLTVPGIPYGTFQLELQIYNPKKKMIGCLRVDVDSIQKKLI